MSDALVSSLEGLRQRYAEPSEVVVKKEMDCLDDFCRRFIALSPFVCLSTADGDGRVDCSPRGDAPGFVKVVDDKTLMLPDRRGNNRVDSLSNVIANPRIGLLFLVPGIDETLRVNGRARITTQSDLMESMAAQGKAPASALEIKAEEVFLHCGKALKRSQLWSGDTQVERSAFPSLGEIVAHQTRIMSKEEGEAYVAESYEKRLY